MEKKDWQKNFEDTIILMMGRIHLRARDVIEELVPMVELELDKAREEGYELACKYLRDEYLEDRKRSLELRSEPKDVLDILGRVWNYKSKLKG